MRLDCYILILLIGILYGEVSSAQTCDSIPPNYPPIYLTKNNPPAGEYILPIVFNGGNYLLNIDTAACPNLYRRFLTNTVTNFEIHPSGYYSLAQINNDRHVVLDTNFNFVDTFKMKGPYDADFHEFVHTDSFVLLLAYDDSVIDMTQFHPLGKPNAVVEGIVIQKQDLNGNKLWQWDSWEHVPFEVTADDISFAASFVDLLHVNSIDFDLDGHYVLSAKHADALIKIHNVTGEVIWYLGGDSSDFTILNDSLGGFYRQHDVHVLENGNILLFDNGSLHPTPQSRAVEYAIDTVNMTASLVWEYTHPFPYVTNIMGSVQRLPDGNTLIGWGRMPGGHPVFTEVDSLGNVVFEMRFDSAHFMSLYRARKIPYQTEVEEPIDTTVDTTAVSIASISKNIRIYPNPANDILIVEFDSPDESDNEFLMTDVYGRLVKRFSFGNNSNSRLSLDISNIAPGFYILSHGPLSTKLIIE